MIVNTLTQCEQAHTCALIFKVDIGKISMYVAHTCDFTNKQVLLHVLIREFSNKKS